MWHWINTDPTSGACHDGAMDLEVGVVVRLRRRAGEEIHGVIAGVGERWLLLHRTYDLDVDGLCAVRRRDLTRVTVDRTGDRIVERSLRHRGVFPEPVVSVGLDRTADVLTTMAALGVVTIHTERADHTVCWLGMPTDVDAERKRFTLAPLTPAATWDAEPMRFRFRDLTRVDVGTAYAARLLELAGPLPR